MTKKIKNIIIGTSMLGISVSVITPVVITSVNKNKIHNYDHLDLNSDTNKVFNFNNKSFNSREELIDYAMAQSNKQIVKEKQNVNWSLEINNKIQNFNDPKVLMNFIESKIAEYNTASSTSISINHNGEIPTSELSKLYDVKNLKTQKIYRGKDNQYFTSEKEAKESYLEIHDAYYFDGIYFRNKEELSNFIRQNIDKYKNLINEGQSFVIQNSRNFKSKPINATNVNTDETKKYIEDFVNLNKYEYLEIKNSDDTLSYIDADDINKDSMNLTSKINNYSYVKMQSNQGKGSYLVDLHKDDEFQLYGPYYVQSSSIINQMKDKSKWHKISGTDHEIVNNIFENKKMSSFFGTLMTDLVDLNNDILDMPFKFADIENECENYFNMLKTNYYNVYSDVMNLYRRMKEGKNYNLFMKIPILFIKTMNSIMEFGLEQFIIDKTREFYTFIMREFDSRIYEVIPNYFLQNRAGTTLSLSNIFNFHSPTFDLNTDIETFIDKIIYSYPRMKEIIDFIFNIKDLQLTTLNLISPDLEYYDMLFSTWISIKSSIEKEWYLKMWEALWTTDANQLLQVSNEIRETNNRPKGFVNKFFIQNIEYLDTTQTNYLKFIESKINNDYDYSNMRLEILNIINSKEIDRELKFQKVILLLNAPFWETDIINARNSNDIQLLVKRIFTTKNSLNSLFSNNTIFNSCSISRIESYEYKYTPGQLKSETWNQDIVLAYLSAINTLLGAFGSRDNIMQVIKKIKNTAGRFLKFLTVVNAVFVVGSILLDFAANMFQVEHFSYKFESKDVKYIWNGGKTNKWFYGIIESPVSTIDNMKLLGPLEVVSSHTNNNYYYSGKYYDDLEVLKKQQLWDIVKNRYNPPFIKTIYSFEKINPYMLSRPKYAFEKVGSISDDDENLSKYVFENIKNKGHYTSENVYKYGNGIVYDENISLDQNINQVTSNILPVKVAILPNLKNNYPIYRDDDKVDNSLDKYELPETSWTSLNGYIKNKSKKKYVIYDPNIDPNKNSEVQTNELIIKKMQEKFYSQFDVTSKDIILDDLHTRKLFSEYNNNILYNNIYYAKNEKHEFKIFNSKDNAINWLLQQYKFKTYYKEMTTNIYNFGGKSFHSLDEYIKWVLSQTNIVEKESK